MIINRGNFGLFRRNRADSGRPVIRPEMGPADWLLEVFAFTGMILFAGYTIYNFSHLPVTIPTHFNGYGQADEFGDKTSFLVLPGVALFVYGLLTMINLVPHTFNYTVKITAANALRQYTMATRLIRILKSSVIWGFLYISFSTLQVARGVTTGMGVWFLPVFLGIITIPIVVYVIMAARKS